jgi:L-ascorbate metabolism protein UlaG (beta-lactamase superfamily)
MKSNIKNLLTFALIFITTALKAQEQIEIHPVNHGSFVMTYQGKAFYVDPVGDTEFYKEHPDPTIILITDIHGDHLSLNTLQSLNIDKAEIIAPQAVYDKLPKELQKKTHVLKNGDSKSYPMFGMNIEAIPMYNLREEALNFHPKGRGNGYVISLAAERIYISGDTEDIPEMRELTNIDKAFVCMNLPYTMTVESAVSAVVEFKPKVVIPYHYRGKNGLSDVENFKRLIEEKNNAIKVELLKWY